MRGEVLPELNLRRPVATWFHPAGYMLALFRDGRFVCQHHLSMLWSYEGINMEQASEHAKKQGYERI